MPIHQALFQSWDIVKLAGLVGIRYVFVNENLGPLNCRGRAVTFVATKVTKKAFSRKASLPHKPHAANQVKPRAAKCCPTIRLLRPTLLQLLLCPSDAQGHHCFTWFRPKLFCWRVNTIKFPKRYISLKQKKALAWQKSGPGVWREWRFSFCNVRSTEKALRTGRAGWSFFLSWFIHLLLFF